MISLGWGLSTDFESFREKEGDKNIPVFAAEEQPALQLFIRAFTAETNTNVPEFNAKKISMCTGINRATNETAQK